MFKKEAKDQAFLQITAGIFGGTILGITGFRQMLGYGSKNHGCFSGVDSFFHSAGYESCGVFGGLVGIILGCLLGIIIINLIFKLIKTADYFKVAVFLFFGALFLPFLYNFIRFFPESFNKDILIIFPISLIFIILSILPAIIITLIFEGMKRIFKQLRLF